MKKIIIILILSIFNKGFAQFSVSETQQSNKYYQYSDDYFKKVTFRIGGGITLPLGNLKKYFGVSPLVELSLDFPVTSTKSIELAVQFIVPSKKKSFKYIGLIDTVQAKATFVFNPMLRFKKNLSNSKTSQLHVGFGLGASLIKTNARNPFYNEDKENSKKYETVTSILLSPSIDYVIKINKKEELTFGLGVNYSPYKIEGSLKESIGSLALTPKILYSF